MNLKLLQYCGIKFDVNLMYEIIYRLSNINFNNYFNFKDLSYNLKSNPRKIDGKFNFKFQPLLIYLLICVVKYWNFLPENVASAHNLFIFNV